MRGLLVLLMAVGALLLVSMMYVTASMGGSHNQTDLLIEQMGRLYGSQRRIEKELQSISSKLDELTHHPLDYPTAAAALGTPAGKQADVLVDNGRVSVHAQPQNCPNRRPFHALLTAQSSPYQQWQARIMYFHWKKQAAAAGPCGEMGGFTRLCATEGGKPDGLENEIPTVFTKQLSQEIIASHFHFGVLNRPESVRQLFESKELMSHITSDYVLVLETDHVLMQPIPNLATETMPAAYDFGYMHAHVGQNRIIRKYWPEGDASQLDPVGPSPLLIHVDQLRKITPRWLDFSMGLRSNDDAESVIQGWVQEMWGYSIAAASLGIKHKVVKSFQVEYGSLTPHVPEEFTNLAYIFHYTYGIEYTMEGKPQGINQIGEWSLDKRHYGNDHPPRNLQLPPKGANAAAFWLTKAWNEASAGIANWPDSHSMGTIGWRRNKPSTAEVAASPLASRVSGTRWTWGGVDGFEFRPGGELVTPWGNGVWGIVAKSDSANTPSDARAAQISACTDCLFADFANANHNLRFSWDQTPPTFKSVRVGDLETVMGTWLSGGSEAGASKLF